MNIIINSTLAAVLVVAVAIDHRTGRIPNVLTLTVIAAGIVLNSVKGGTPGATSALCGVAAGVGVFVIPFVMGGIGGGDVKLMAAVGALKGPYFVLAAFFCTAVMGGLVALVLLALRRGERKAAWARVRTTMLLLAMGVKPEHSGPAVGFPYAVCIAAGVAGAFVTAPILVLWK